MNNNGQMTDVAAQFGAERLPVRDGLYRVGSPPRTVLWREELEIGEPFELDGSEMDTVIDIFCEAALPDGYLVCGEGSWGSEGFFARLATDRSLIWVVYLEHGNPFISIDVMGRTATITNNLDRTVTIDLDNPNFTSLPRGSES
jgi:hypothetical protein